MFNKRPIPLIISTCLSPPASKDQHSGFKKQEAAIYDPVKSYGRMKADEDAGRRWYAMPSVAMHVQCLSMTLVTMQATAVWGLECMLRDASFAPADLTAGAWQAENRDVPSEPFCPSTGYNTTQAWHYIFSWPRRVLLWQQHCS